jgi:hypothetical protein
MVRALYITVEVTTSAASEPDGYRHPRYTRLRAHRDVARLIRRSIELDEALDSKPACLSKYITALQVTEQNRTVTSRDALLVFRDDNRPAEQRIEGIARNVRLQGRLTSRANDADECRTRGGGHHKACILHVGCIERTEEVDQVRVRGPVGTCP